MKVDGEAVQGQELCATSTSNTLNVEEFKEKLKEASNMCPGIHALEQNAPDNGKTDVTSLTGLKEQYVPENR